MKTTNISSNFEPLYVCFNFNGTKVSELFIPTENKTLLDLITENSYKYNIPKEVFIDLVHKNSVNLSENNSIQKSQNSLKINEPVVNNNLDANEIFNCSSTRSNTYKNLQSFLKNDFPNSHKSNLDLPNNNIHNNNKKKEMIYNEILSLKDNEIPKSKLLDLASSLLENTNKYLQEHKTGVNNIIYNKKENIKNINDNNNKNQNQPQDKTNINLLNKHNQKILFEVSSLNQKEINDIKNIHTKNTKSNLRNNNVAKTYTREGLSSLKSPRNINIDLNMVSGKSTKKTALQHKENQMPRGDLEKKDPKSPKYNFLNTNTLLVKNYKRVNTYAEKEQFAKLIKGNLNNDRLYNIKDYKTYQVYNYKKILPENILQISVENEAYTKARISETDQLVNKVLIDLNSKNENEINQNDDVLIENLDQRLILNNDEENSKAFGQNEFMDVQAYANLNDIIMPSGNSGNGISTSNKNSKSNSQYVSLKNKLENTTNDYILNFKDKSSNNLFSNKNIIDNFLNLNNNNLESNKIHNDKDILFDTTDKSHQMNNQSETPEERLLGSEPMSEKSSFLFNNFPKSSVNYDISKTYSKNNIHFSNLNKNNNKVEVVETNQNFKNNNSKLNLTPYNNLNNILWESTERSKNKSLKHGGNFIKKMKKNQLSNSVSKSERSISYGERLFYKGIVFEDKKGKKNELYRKMKEAEFEKNCTFRPKINPNSIALSVKANFSRLGVSSVGNPGGLLNNFSSPNLFNNKKVNYENYENNLYNSYNNFENLSNFNSSGKFTSENNVNNTPHHNYDLHNIRYKNKQCQHNPVLNNTVNFIENDKANFSRLNTNSKFLNKTCFKSPEEIEVVSKRLHGNAERYRNKKLLLQENYYAQLCPFSPEIISREEGEIPNMDNFFNRLQSWVDRRNEKYEIDLEKKHFDQHTGNRLFSPQINKSQKHNDFALNESTKERFYELYENYKKKQNKLSEINEKNSQEISFIANIAHINEKSKLIVDEMQTKIFVHLFEVLSDKTSNLINGNIIDMSEIPEKIQIILMPLLSELKEQNETLTLDEFIMASKHLYASLPIHFKQNLMEWYLSFNKMKKNMSIQDYLNFPFKPEICERSRAIAENSKLFTANLLMKSIDKIKLKQEVHFDNQNPHEMMSNKNLERRVINNFNKQNFNPAIRNDMLRNYYEHNERINETLAEENNSEN